MNYQQTLKSSISLTGVGLHSGAPVIVTVRPARPNHGISFVRVDLEGFPQISGSYKNVSNTQLATTVGHGRITVSTVEHLLAALQGMGVDNAIVEVNGPELPILDGSAAPYCEAMMTVGVEMQTAFRPYLAIRKRVEVYDGDKWAVAEPSTQLEVHATISWAHPVIGNQEFHYQEGKTDFAELASARTFGFLKDVEALKKMGLARGASLDNAIGLDDTGVLNPDGLRFKNEFVRHKVLDALGDFLLAGIPIQGYIRLHKAGHDLHNQLLTAIFKNPDNYEIVEASGRERRRVGFRTALASGLAAGV